MTDIEMQRAIKEIYLSQKTMAGRIERIEANINRIADCTGETFRNAVFKSLRDEASNGNKN